MGIQEDELIDEEEADEFNFVAIGIAAVLLLAIVGGLIWYLETAYCLLPAPFSACIISFVLSMMWAPEGMMNSNHLASNLGLMVRL
jgi:hypothetical protein